MGVWLDVVDMGWWGIGNIVRVDSWHLGWLSELLGHWLDGRAALWVVRVGLLLELVALCGLKNLLVGLFVLFLGSLSLGSLEVLAGNRHVIDILLLSIVDHL